MYNWDIPMKISHTSSIRTMATAGIAGRGYHGRTMAGKAGKEHGKQTTVTRFQKVELTT
jgi:hypothetical protein